MPFISLQCSYIYENFCQASDIHNEASELLRIRDYLFNELAKKTGQTVETVSSLMTKSYVVFLAVQFDSHKR